jgi:hypothetical protein
LHCDAAERACSCGTSCSVPAVPCAHCSVTCWVQPLRTATTQACKHPVPVPCTTTVKLTSTEQLALTSIAYSTTPQDQISARLVL